MAAASERRRGVGGLRLLRRAATARRRSFCRAAAAGELGETGAVWSGTLPSAARTTSHRANTPSRTGPRALSARVAANESSVVGSAGWLIASAVRLVARNVARRPATG